MHTGNPAFKHRANKDPLIIDLLACEFLAPPHSLKADPPHRRTGNALLAWVSDHLTQLVLTLPESALPREQGIKIVRAFNKIM